MLGIQSASHGDRPLSHGQLLPRHRHRYGQRLSGVDLQQHEHPVVIAGHDLGSQTLAVGQRHQNRRRLLRQIERAGDDPTIRTDNQAGGRSFANEHPCDTFQTAKGLDPDDRRSNRCDCLANCQLLQFAKVFFRQTPRPNRAPRRREPAGPIGFASRPRTSGTGG